MSNFIYSKAKESLFSGQIDVSTKNIRILLIDTSTYTPLQNVDQFVSDIPNEAIKKRSGNLINVTYSLGVLDASDITLSDHDGSAFDSIVGYQVGTSDSNSLVIFYINTANGLPFTGSASVSPVTIVWDNGPNKIISL